MTGSESVRIAPIKSVSPSKADALLGCRLSEAFRAAGTVHQLPTHPKAHFGVLAHAFLRDAARGAFNGLSVAEIRVEWRIVVEAYEEKLKRVPFDCAVIPLLRTCDDFEVNAYRLIAAASRLAATSNRPRERTSFRSGAVEVENVSRDGQIVGRLDRITWEDGELAVTDVKTGQVNDSEGKLRAGLKIQLLLYSYLVHEQFGRWPKTLRVLPLHGEPITVPFAPVEAQELAERMKAILIDANQLIANVRAGRANESELASPSVESCRFCRYRPSCESYWEARRGSPQACWARDVSGVVITRKLIGGGFHVLEIHGAEGETMIVRGIRESALVEIASGMAVRICDLKGERAANVYSWRSTSYVWAREGRGGLIAGGEGN